MRKITDMLVLYVLCAVLESACGITNHVVVSLLLLFIEVCAVIYLQSMAGRTFAVTVYLLSFLVIKETFFVGVFWRCGIALYPVGYRQDTVADTMDCF